MTKIISISNHKGGVGKTTSAINIGAGLNRLGKKVLLVDLDPQTNLSQSLGIRAPTDNIYRNLKGITKADPLPLLDGLSIIPSSIELTGIELEISGEFNREYFLKDILDPLRDKFDFILIDCPPSLGLLTVNAFTASDSILIPLQAEYLAIQGLSNMLQIIKKIKARLNPLLTLEGVFITQYDQRKILNQNISETIGAHFGGDLFKTKIRNSISLAEAPAKGLDIFRYNPKSHGGEDYKNLCEELLSKQNNKKTKKQ